MTTDRIKEIQEGTAYPNSKSVQIALLQVWNECEQQKQSEIDELNQAVDNLMKARHELQEEVERMRSELAKIYMYAEQMSIDLIGYNGLIDGSHESLDNYKNHMQSINHPLTTKTKEMNITEEQKQEADRVVEKYNKNYTLNAEPKGYQTRRIATPNKYQCAIQNRQSVLDELKSLFPLQDYNDEVILVSKCKSIMAQIEYLKSKI